MLAYVIGVVLFALAICVSVALHEAGHMVTARMFGMRVRRYFVGFGPTVFSFRRGETEYGLKAIPLGGFCDIAGMTALDEVTPEEAPRAMWRFKAWKRTVVMSAGSITHFLLGFVVLFVMAATMGLPNVDQKPIVSTISDCVRGGATVDQVNNPVCQPGDPAPAKKAGLLPGDVVLSVAGKPTPTWSEMVTQVKAVSGPVPVVVERGGKQQTFVVDVPKVLRPAANGGTETVGAVGVGVARTIQYSPLGAFGGAASFTGDMFARTWDGLMAFPKRIPAVFNSIFGAERDPDTPVSVVGASRLGGEAVEAGLWQVFLLLLASLNFFIGVFNLLPLLPMDGGHIAIVCYERVRDWLRGLRGKPAGGPVDYTKLSAITMVLVVIGGGVTLLTVTADIVNPIRLQ